MDSEYFPAPFGQFAGEVRREWIDSNGHMNLAYYIVLFDEGSELFFEALGYGPAYRTAHNHGPYAVETHTLYQRELLAGARVRVTSQLLAADAKRLHVAYEMFCAEDSARAACQEVLYLNVDLAARRVTPFAPGLQERIGAAMTAHLQLPRPAWVGRHVGMAPSKE